MKTEPPPLVLEGADFTLCAVNRTPLGGVRLTRRPLALPHTALSAGGKTALRKRAGGPRSVLGVLCGETAAGNACFGKIATFLHNSSEAVCESDQARFTFRFRNDVLASVLCQASPVAVSQELPRESLRMANVSINTSSRFQGLGVSAPQASRNSLEFPVSRVLREWIVLV